MKKLNYKIKWLIFILLILVSCKKESSTIMPTGITLSQNTLTINVGDTESLSIIINPLNVNNPLVKWKSSDTTIAKVSSNGVITAVAPGTASITVTTDQGNIFSTCAVTVLKWTNYNTNNCIILSNNVTSLCLDNKGNMWLGYGLYHVGESSYSSTSWENFLFAVGLTDDNYGALAIANDKQGNIWIGTAGGGVLKIGNSPSIFYNINNSGLANNLVNAVAIDSLGNIWFGTAVGISKFDGTNWTTYNTPNNFIPTFLAFNPKDGKLWVGSYSGIFVFDGTNWITYNTSNSGLVSNDITDIAFDSKENTWISTTNGISEYNGTNWTNFTIGNSGLENNDVISIAFDTSGNVWFGSLPGVISKYNGSNWVNYIAPTEIYSMLIDKQGNIWFGGNGGLTELQTGVSK